MPPKGSRGRGRGRGGTAASAEKARKDLQAQEGQPSVNEVSTSASGADNLSTISTSLSIFQQGDILQNPSPNTSPASAPTETPAPTPVRAPVQRLESLGNLNRGGLGTALGTAGRVMSGRIKPKAGRRGLEEREKAERDEQARRRGKEIEAQREQGIPPTAFGSRGGRGSGRGDGERGRGRGRGRGDAMGRGGLDRNTKALREASGLFGVAPAAAEKKPGSVSSVVGARQGGAAVTNSATGTRPATVISSSSTKVSKVKQDLDALPITGGGSHTETANVKSEVPEPVYPEEQEEGNRPVRRVDIERINISSDDDVEDEDVVTSSRIKGKGRNSSGKGGLRPVRLHRVEHKERVTMVNTEPAAMPLLDTEKETDEESGSLLVPHGENRGTGERFSRNGKSWSGAWRDDDVHVKSDPGAPPDLMSLDVDVEPAVRNKSKGPAKQQTVEIDTTAPSATIMENSKAVRKKPTKETQPVLQTEEDMAEYMRHLEDIQILAEELGGIQNSQPFHSTARGIDLDGEMSDNRPAAKNKEGRLYLFQFPPILPPLHNQIKKEDIASGAMDVMEVDGPPLVAPEPVDLTKPDTEEAILIKSEPGQGPSVPSVPELVPEEGRIGRLIVRASGKVELDWGGTILQLGRGADTDFLTTTVILDGMGEVESPDVVTGMGMGYRKDNQSAVRGTCSGMGRVMGKFVATPDWSQMTEME